MTETVFFTGLSAYREVHALQRRLVEARARDEIPDHILLLQHPPTITLGRRRDASDNVLVPDDVEVVEVERGGDATWHGPGQLVAYPIVQLRGERRDLHRHLHGLEQAVIDLLEGHGLRATRDSRNTGVWLPAEPHPQKVCSIGIACRKWVTWHGLALNVDPDPSGFARIRPCGFDAEVMTRLADHLAPCPDIIELARALADALCIALGLDPPRYRARPLEQFGIPIC